MRRNVNARKPDATEAAWHTLLRLFGLVRQVMEPYFARFGISGPQWGVLRVLQRAESNGEAELRLRDVGQRLLIQPPSVTGVVDRLERRGLVQRSHSKADLRARCLSLTPAGSDMISKVLVGHATQIRLPFAGLNPQELERLLALLTRLETNLRVLAGRPSGVAAPKSART